MRYVLRLAYLASMWTWARFVYYAFRRRYKCPKGQHGDHWQYFGGRTRICRICHVEQWFDPGRGWVERSDRRDWERTHTRPSPLDDDEPTNGT